MKKNLVLILLLCVILIVAGCSLKNNKDTTVYTDIDKIQSVLPKIYESNSVIDVHFICETLGSNKFSLIPGPSDYKYTGVITIDQDFAQSIYDIYKFEDSDIVINESLKEFIKNEEDPWMTSSSFITNFKPQSYGGYIYILDDQIYFEISTT